jgi:predicted secreted protein
MKIAICQPYFAPYLGYFQLINSVDIFVSYDDVNFIKRGWINRNNILMGGEPKLFSIPLKKASQNKLINEVYVNYDDKWVSQFMKTLDYNYKKSENFDNIMPIVENLFKNNKNKTIADLTLDSMKEFCDYLDIKTEFKVSSQLDYTKTDDKSINLINICKSESCDHYINPIGGVELYDKTFFKERGIKLNFIQGKGSLSIIDVCMNKSKEEIKESLSDFNLT